MLICLTLFINVNSVFACSCAESPPPIEALKEADAVFIGTVIAVNVKEKENDRITTFFIDKTFKGKIRNYIQVKTSIGGASCGFGFEYFKQYIVYAFGGDNELYTSICTRTANILYANQDLKDFKSDVPNNKILFFIWFVFGLFVFSAVAFYVRKIIRDFNSLRKNDLLT